MEESKYLSVTALTKYIKYKFDHDVHLKSVLLKGEISNFKHHSRGHFYFTLKDDNAQISAIMFASASSKVPFRPEDGMSVLVEGYITVYEQSGQYQIYVKQMDQDGLGSLYLAYEQLKEKLQKEGLFDPSHKKAIPRFPKKIGVLTSPTGAAVRDIIHIVNRRFPLSDIIVYPTLVQGEYAKDNIVKNIESANKDALVDVIILGRGGGSIEDLWPFNEEMVAYAIFKSKIPIISSVGHETDFTISDFVADLRAPTPSGGAELAVPNQQDLMDYISKMESNMKQSLERLLKFKQSRLESLKQSYIFVDPLRITEKNSRKLDYLREKLLLLSPKNRIKQAGLDVTNAQERLQDRMEQITSKKGHEMTLLMEKLELLNPLSIMKKGYSVSKQDGSIITSVKNIQKDQTLETSFQDGSVVSKVLEIRKGE
jgi:exodeoxyribonuclease VII large subunit